VKILRAVKIAAINILSFLILLAVINWIAGFFLKSSQATRDQLPNYEQDRDYAKAVFKDYNSIKHEYYPFVGWKTLPFNGKTTTIDQQGRRVHRVPAFGETKEKSVHFFGGSTMWGEGSDDQHTIPALFNVLHPELDVVNHGQLAYNTRQEVDALISLYSKNEHPDIVVFYDGVNDAAFLCPREINELPAHRLVPMFRQKIYIGKSVMVREALNKIFTENIFRLIRRYSGKENKESPYDCISDPGKAEEIAEMFMLNWELAHEIVTNRGGKFIAVLQPAAFIGNPRTDHLQIDEDFRTNFSHIYERLKSKIQERNHPWIFDLSHVLDNDEYVFIDFCHVSPNGNEIIAKEISHVIDRHL
jgi:hypothetical protein